MLQSKNTEWLKGYKNTHIYSTPKSLTSDPKTQADWKWGNGKRFSMQMEMKAGVAIPKSDKNRR